MKKLFYLILLLPLIWSCDNGNKLTNTTELKTFVDSASYAQGVFMSKQFEKFQVEGEGPVISPFKYAAGLEDGLNQTPKFDEDQASDILERYQLLIQESGIRRGQARGEKFQNENKTKDGVVVTESGLQYKVIESGSGISPTKEDIVQVHYEGRLVNGEIFDSSIGAEPIEFKVGEVLPGWVEALQLMKEGGKMQVVIPSDLAYGDRGNQLIGPAETLIFELELIKVNP